MEQTRVYSNSVNPGTYGRLAPEGVQMLPDFYKDFLGSI
jgi:hypothetical protein